jgi:hypothetical protein
MTVDNLSARARMGALHGRLGRGYPRVVPQSGTASEAEANYITDELPFKLSGHCFIDGTGRYSGVCMAKRGGVCRGNYDTFHCPVGKRAKDNVHGCLPFSRIDPTSRCSVF